MKTRRNKKLKTKKKRNFRRKQNKKLRTKKKRNFRRKQNKKSMKGGICTGCSFVDRSFGLNCVSSKDSASTNCSGNNNNITKCITDCNEGYANVLNQIAVYNDPSVPDQIKNPDETNIDTPLTPLIPNPIKFRKTKISEQDLTDCIQRCNHADDDDDTDDEMD